MFKTLTFDLFNMQTQRKLMHSHTTVHTDFNPHCTEGNATKGFLKHISVLGPRKSD